MVLCASPLIHSSVLSMDADILQMANVNIYFAMHDSSMKQIHVLRYLYAIQVLLSQLQTRDT